MKNNHFGDVLVVIGVFILLCGLAIALVDRQSIHFLEDHHTITTYEDVGSGNYTGNNGN